MCGMFSGGVTTEIEQIKAKILEVASTPRNIPQLMIATKMSYSELLDILDELVHEGSIIRTSDGISYNFVTSLESQL